MGRGAGSPRREDIGDRVLSGATGIGPQCSGLQARGEAARRAVAPTSVGRCCGSMYWRRMVAKDAPPTAGDLSPAPADGRAHDRLVGREEQPPSSLSRRAGEQRAAPAARGRAQSVTAREPRAGQRARLGAREHLEGPRGRPKKSATPVGPRPIQRDRIFTLNSGSCRSDERGFDQHGPCSIRENGSMPESNWRRHCRDLSV